MRFDVVLVVPGRLPRHLAAAFDASDYYKFIKCSGHEASP
jgi:hypothetical protein